METGSSVLVVGHPTVASHLDSEWIVETCETTVAAIEILDDNDIEPQIILSEHSPPTIDCFQLLQDLNQTIPVVFLTTNGSSELATTAFRNGAASYLDLETVDDERAALREQLDRISRRTASTQTEADRDNNLQSSPDSDHIEEFVSIMSHELRTPVQKAKSGIDLIAADCDSEYIDETRGTLDRMEELLSELLSVVKYGNPVEETHTVDLETVINKAWPEHPTATLEIESSLPAVDAEESRLQQIFENLFQNAIEHNTGEIQIRVGVIDHTDSAPTQETIALYIADNGGGLSPEKRKKVFEYGYTESKTGTGLGLAIVERIVAAFDWKISLTESRDGGARFEIRNINTD